MQTPPNRKSLSLSLAVHGRIIERAAKMSTEFGRPVAVGEVIKHLLDTIEAQEKPVTYLTWAQRSLM